MAGNPEDYLLGLFPKHREDSLFTVEMWGYREGNRLWIDFKRVTDKVPTGNGGTRLSTRLVWAIMTQRPPWAGGPEVPKNLGAKGAGEWRCDRTRQCIILSIDSVDVFVLEGVQHDCEPQAGETGNGRYLRRPATGAFTDPISWEVMSYLSRKTP